MHSAHVSWGLIVIMLRLLEGCCTRIMWINYNSQRLDGSTLQVHGWVYVTSDVLWETHRCLLNSVMILASLSVDRNGTLLEVFYDMICGIRPDISTPLHVQVIKRHAHMSGGHENWRIVHSKAWMYFTFGYWIFPLITVQR